MKDHALLSNTELLLVAASYLRANQPDDTIYALRSLLERDPQDANALYLLAVQHSALGLMEEARAEFTAALAIAPSLFDARLQFAILLLATNDQEHAKAVLMPLIEDPTSEVHQSLAQVLWHCADNDTQSAIARIDALTVTQEAYKDLYQCVSDFVRRESKQKPSPRNLELGRYKQYN
jgi:Flp pilus assembly protein TadD